MDVSVRPFYLLDTNIIGYIASGRSQAARTMLRQALTDGEVSICTITEAEIRFGLARRPEATRLHASIEALLGTFRIRPWDSASAIAFGRLRNGLQAAGKSLALMDLLIASHAFAYGATLVSHDQAFIQAAPFLTVVNWASDV